MRHVCARPCTRALHPPHLHPHQHLNLCHTHATSELDMAEFMKVVDRLRKEEGKAEGFAGIVSRKANTGPPMQWTDREGFTPAETKDVVERTGSGKHAVRWRMRIGRRVLARRGPAAPAHGAVAVCPPTAKRGALARPHRWLCSTRSSALARGCTIRPR